MGMLVSIHQNIVAVNDIYFLVDFFKAEVLNVY